MAHEFRENRGQGVDKGQDDDRSQRTDDLEQPVDDERARAGGLHRRADSHHPQDQHENRPVDRTVGLLGIEAANDDDDGDRHQIIAGVGGTPRDRPQVIGLRSADLRQNRIAGTFPDLTPVDQTRAAQASLSREWDRRRDMLLLVVRFAETFLGKRDNRSSLRGLVAERREQSRLGEIHLAHAWKRQELLRLTVTKRNRPGFIEQHRGNAPRRFDRLRRLCKMLALSSRPMLPNLATVALAAVTTGSKAAKSATAMPATAMPSEITPGPASTVHAMVAINAALAKAILTTPSRSWRILRAFARKRRDHVSLWRRPTRGIYVAYIRGIYTNSLISISFLYAARI